MEAMGSNNEAEMEGIASSKEVKLQLPLRTHVSLHSMKLIKNQSIRDSVVRALDQFFRQHPVDAFAFGAPDA
jgi:hypothetical protein